VWNGVEIASIQTKYDQSSRKLFWFPWHDQATGMNRFHLLTHVDLDLSPEEDLVAR
jgi:hypothetical protein